VRATMIDAALAHSIRLVVLDVDGVLTDGGIYLGAVDGKPMELKRYDIQDGLGIYLLQKAGIRVAIITGRVSESVRLRAAELGIEDLAQDPNAQKLPALLSMLDKHGIAPSETAFVGDDFPDLAVLRLVGLPVAVENAVPEIASACAVRLTRSGGRGAIREFAEMLLRARGEWDAVTERYVGERSLPISRSSP
jgi:3-deoxy-D-manno-octulosonate 8-phosphate phosphatase (KDO 8-P phosphatase)